MKCDGGIIFFSAMATGVAIMWLVVWLSNNWYKPYTKIVTNGLRHKVLQLNIFGIWQTVDEAYQLHIAEESAQRQIRYWHERHDTFRPVKDHERVASRIEQANRR